jgi:hypothetical protein
VMEYEPFIEKCCSRCERLTWDSTTGVYNELDCPNDGKPCDTKGIQWWTDGEGKLSKHDKDGTLIKEVD